MQESHGFKVYEWGEDFFIDVRDEERAGDLSIEAGKIISYDCKVGDDEYHNQQIRVWAGETGIYLNDGCPPPGFPVEIVIAGFPTDEQLKLILNDIMSA